MRAIALYVSNKGFDTANNRVIVSFYLDASKFVRFQDNEGGPELCPIAPLVKAPKRQGYSPRAIFKK